MERRQLKHDVSNEYRAYVMGHDGNIPKPRAPSYARTTKMLPCGQSNW